MNYRKKERKKKVPFLRIQLLPWREESLHSEAEATVKEANKMPELSSSTTETDSLTSETVTLFSPFFFSRVFLFGMEEKQKKKKSGFLKRCV